MEAIKIKYNVLNMALKRFGEALLFFNTVKETSKKNVVHISDDIAYTVARDSIIQRFEFSVELFWKYLRLYLEEHEKVELEANTPRGVIRSACQARILDETVATIFMAMINSRNLTSHIYKEEIAEQLARDIPQYYEQMMKTVVMLKP
jgi:nucleotidyltransferase substrate binding protein (TIGR01987 family)